jgi:hypothetical protein
MPNLTYEAYLDEVATLLTELYDLDDAVAIQLVVDAQAHEYFSPHDDHPAMRTLARAKEDAVALYKARRPTLKQARPAAKPPARAAAKPGARPSAKPTAKPVPAQGLRKNTKPR